MAETLNGTQGSSIGNSLNSIGNMGLETLISSGPSIHSDCEKIAETVIGTQGTC
jgi:hypothetical protein